MQNMHLKKVFLLLLIFGLIGFLSIRMIHQANPAVTKPLIPSFITQTRINYDPDQIPLGLNDALQSLIHASNEYTDLSSLQELTISTEPTDHRVFSYILVPVVNISSPFYQISIDELNRILIDQKIPARFPQVLALTEDKNLLIDNSNTHNEILFFDEVTELFKSMDNAGLAFIPFESLTPQVKPLRVDDLSILRPEVANDTWHIAKHYYADGDNVEIFLTDLRQYIDESNRNTQQLASLVLTGVTAISRGVEYEIAQRKDPIFPARGVMDVLRQADLTHVNSENPFFDECEPEMEGIILCGKTASIQALSAIGVDIVDLTGNHQNDYGPEKNIESITHLEDAGFKYFGGGKTDSDAEKILYIEVNGNRLAFLGYNYFDSLNGPEYHSLAWKDRPGSNYYSADKVARNIEEARANADIVIVDYQFIEQYSYEPLPEQVEVFQNTIDYGADIVVGVQSHQPQTIDFYQGGVIFYGLGNFFFDQMWSEPTRQGVIPWVTFYDGQILSIELYTTLLYDYAQPRFTSGEEKTQLLETILALD